MKGITGRRSEEAGGGQRGSEGAAGRAVHLKSALFRTWPLMDVLCVLNELSEDLSVSVHIWCTHSW